MKILITGIRGLSKALRDVYTDHAVTCVSKSGGFDINNIDQWGREFLDVDTVFNCAYDGFGQTKVLEYFYNAWRNDASKIIVNIGSKIITNTRLELSLDQEYWPYRLHKQTLQIAHDTMNRSATCSMKMINPGPINTDMIAHINCVKINPEELAIKIRECVADPYIKRLDIWP